MASVTSFEFVTPSEYKNHCIEANKRPIKNVSMETKSAEEIPYRDDTKQEHIYVEEENPDEKENVPPIEDKENIPPAPLHGLYPTEPPKSENCVTPEQSVLQSNADVSVLPNDLQKGVDLINALIDSRKVGNADKKKLIRKIVRNLLKSRDPKDITKMILTYSEKSGTKVTQEPSSALSELEKTDESPKIIGKSTKHTISGVSTLSSSPSIDESKHSKEEMSKANKSTKKDWLQPLTQSEIEKENARKIEQEKNQSIKKTADKSKEEKIDLKSKRKESNIQEFLENEKKNHFNWIDQEIEHLTNLKLLLESIKLSGSDKDGSCVDKANSNNDKDKDFIVIYENFRRTKKNSSKNSSEADISSTLIGKYFTN